MAEEPGYLLRVPARPEQLGLRFQAYQYVALLVRKPQAIGVVSGAGLITPTFP